MDKSSDLKSIIYNRIPHYHKDFPLILLWSEKSGCTSLAKWFFFQIGLLDKALEYDPWVHNYEFEVYKQQSGYREQLENDLLTSNKKVYKLVRNPYKRIVSSFIMIHSPTLDRIKDWRQFRFNLIGNIKEFFYNNRDSIDGISYKQFLLYLKQKGAGVGIVNGHIAQQYIPGEEVFIHKYIYLENFEKEIKEIENKFGLIESSLSELSKSNHHFTSRMVYEGDYADIITTDPLFQLWPTYKSFYNEETKQLVEEIFQQDFKAYGYQHKL